MKEQAPIAAPSGSENQIAKKKRGRPSTSKTEERSENQVQEQPLPKKKRGRPSLQRAEEEAPAKSPQEAESSKGRRRARPSNEQQELESSEEPVSKGRGRPEKKRRPSISDTTTTKRRARRSDASDTGPESQAPASSLATSQKTRKRRKGNDTAGEDEGSEANATAGDKSKKRKEADTRVVENTKSKDQEERSEQPRRSQKSTQDDDDQETPETEEPPDYQHLAEVTHRVSRQTIEAKWESLPARCIELVSSLLEDIQKPVVVRLGDERRRAQASTALQMVSRRLVSKISKGLPFPPSTGARREDDFDFEKILDHSRDLEAQLTVALHANDLLESELRKETAHLEAEEDALLQLETNAKAEASRRREAGRKLHSLLQSEDAASSESLKDETGLDPDVQEAPLSLVSFTLSSICVVYT